MFLRDAVKNIEIGIVLKSAKYYSTFCLFVIFFSCHHIKEENMMLAKTQSGSPTLFHKQERLDACYVKTQMPSLYMQLTSVAMTGLPAVTVWGAVKNICSQSLGFVPKDTPNFGCRLFLTAPLKIEMLKAPNSEIS